MSIPFLKEIQIRFFRIGRAIFAFAIGILVLLVPLGAHAQLRPAPVGGHRAVVVDERLAVLRDEASLSARLLKRLSRGRKVSLMNIKRSPEGVMFYRVAVTRRTRGWLQVEAVVSAARHRDDERLVNLIRASKDFDRVARASIFLNTFPGSVFRPSVLLILGATAEDVARKLSVEAARRLDEVEMKANRAPMLSYFLNYNGLDRYRRLGIAFIFDQRMKTYHYNGAAWREIVRRYPQSEEAEKAREQLEVLKVADRSRLR